MPEYYTVNENGDWLLADETTEDAKVYDADEHLASLITRVKEWDHENVRKLLDILDQIPEVLRDAGRAPRTADVIDYSDLPTETIPDGLEVYPIWACDKRGNCLVGEAADSIEPLEDIVEWYAAKKE